MLKKSCSSWLLFALATAWTELVVHAGQLTIPDAVAGERFTFHLADDSFCLHHSDTVNVCAPVSLAIVTRPLWLQFDAQTRALQGTPPIRDIGTRYNITVQATSNNTGVDTLNSFLLEVIAPAQVDALNANNSLNLLLSTTSNMLNDNSGTDVTQITNPYPFIFGVAGAICAVSLLVVLAIYIRRRRRHQQHQTKSIKVDNCTLNGRRTSIRHRVLKRLKKGRGTNDFKTLLTSELFIDSPDLEANADEELEVSREISMRQIQLAFPNATAAVAMCRRSFGRFEYDKLREPSPPLQAIATPDTLFGNNAFLSPPLYDVLHKNAVIDRCPPSPTLSSVSESLASTMCRPHPNTHIQSQITSGTSNTVANLNNLHNASRLSDVHDPPLHTPPVMESRYCSHEVSATVGQAFSYLPSFITQSASVMKGYQPPESVYIATLVDGSPLPAWLSCHRISGRFNGIPYTSDTDIMHIRVAQIKLPVPSLLPPLSSSQFTDRVNEIEGDAGPCEVDIGSFVLTVNEDESNCYDMTDFITPMVYHHADTSCRKRTSTASSLTGRTELMIHLGDDLLCASEINTSMSAGAAFEPLSPNSRSRLTGVNEYTASSIDPWAGSLGKRETDIEWERWIRSSQTHATLERELRLA